MAASTSSAVSQAQNSKANPWRWFYVVLGVLVVAIVSFNVIRPITVLPRITLGPGYIMRNQDGERVTSEDFRGKLTFYTFTYSRCGADCPLTAVQIADFHAQLSQQVPDDMAVNLVTISLDPEFDTPDVLAEFTHSLPMDREGRVPWQFLTGDSKRTKFVVGGGFSVYYTPQPEADDSAEYQVYFEPHSVLVDGWGIIRAEYGTAVPNLDIALRDIDLVTAEARNSRGNAKIAYEAAHLFLCYPR